MFKQNLRLLYKLLKNLKEAQEGIRRDKMKKLKKKMNKENSDLIESFIQLQDHPENYEVWVPYFHQGIVGFIDLVIENENEISLFKFSKKANNLEEDIKALKLEKSVFPKSRAITSKTIHSYLVLKDSEKNRETVLSKEDLIENQPLDLLFLDKGRKRIESVFELKDNIPRLFQTEDIRLEKNALKALSTNPNHSEIERAILELEDPPKAITKRFVRKIQRYMKLNKQPPKNVEKLEESRVNQSKETYQPNSEKTDLKNTQKS